MYLHRPLVLLLLMFSLICHHIFSQQVPTCTSPMAQHGMCSNLLPLCCLSILTHPPTLIQRCFTISPALRLCHHQHSATAPHNAMQLLLTSTRAVQIT
jgi:hypothetical protein